MNGKRWLVLGIMFVALALLVGVIVRTGISAQGSVEAQTGVGGGFTYQGQLKSSGKLVSENCEMAFRLYDGESEGNQVGSAITRTVPISDSLFTVVLDFGGGAFTGDARWLGIKVKCPTDAVYTDLGRQALTAAPYSLHSLSTGALQGYPIATAAPLTDQVLTWDGSAWTPVDGESAPDELKYFHEDASIATSGALDWDSFVIDSDVYLAVANHYNGSTYNLNSKIYRWNGTSFAEAQSIPTNGAYDWEFFTIGSDTYLAVANAYNDSTPNLNSKIYHWNGVSFVEFQSIPTNSAHDWEFFTVGGDAYLAVANASNGSTFNIDSKIYRWNGTSFAEFQSIPTNWAFDWESFTIGGDTYLAIANRSNGPTHNVDSKIYRWNGTTFTETQSIPTNGALDWESFVIDTETYLAVANSRDDSTRNVDSKIYHWNGATFVEFQVIPTNGAADWEFFTIGDDAYLAVANYYNDASHNIDSKVYRWNGTGFVESQAIATSGAQDWEFFTIGSDAYLAVANHYNGSNYNIDSTIYRAVLASRAGTTYLWGRSGADVYYDTGSVGVGTTDPQSALQVEGYIQLDTLTSAPPVADCDEASERGRMKVDTANDLLYICTGGGWVAK